LRWPARKLGRSAGASESTQSVRRKLEPGLIGWILAGNTFHDSL
jgi:hypothetical protein